jgi:hypothetical protein
MQYKHKQAESNKEKKERKRTNLSYEVFTAMKIHIVVL